MRIELHVFPRCEELDQALASSVAAGLREALAEQGRASLVVSGGRTPAGFFRALSMQPLEWSSITVLLADERCVNEEDPSSNARVVRANLLQGPAAEARFLPLFTEQESAEALVSRLNLLPAKFDVVVLGMGDDGHTASIFPDSPQRDCALEAPAGVPALHVEGKAPVRSRITLSASRLLATRRLFLHVTGEIKWAVLGQALGASSATLPVSHFLHAEGVEKHVFWTC